MLFVISGQKREIYVQRAGIIGYSQGGIFGNALLHLHCLRPIEFKNVIIWVCVLVELIDGRKRYWELYPIDVQLVFPLLIYSPPKVKHRLGFDNIYFLDRQKKMVYTFNLLVTFI